MQKCAEQNTNIKRKGLVLLVTRVSRSDDDRLEHETRVTRNTFLLIFVTQNICTILLITNYYCYQPKYVFLLEENSSYVVGENALTP